jgi:hypothetical protein
LSTGKRQQLKQNSVNLTHPYLKQNQLERKKEGDQAKRKLVE